MVLARLDNLRSDFVLAVAVAGVVRFDREDDNTAVALPELPPTEADATELRYEDADMDLNGDTVVVVKGAIAGGGNGACSIPWTVPAAAAAADVPPIDTLERNAGDGTVDPPGSCEVDDKDDDSERSSDRTERRNFMALLVRVGVGCRLLACELFLVVSRSCLRLLPATTTTSNDYAIVRTAAGVGVLARGSGSVVVLVVAVAVVFVVVITSRTCC